ncbi:hypothetical protein DVB69_05190 [Sporosarcina sp. BI001-red]|uniref:S8 family serine peptidase n=1 Tax=Sporosarcina sp. BI001-red TaxID=2282866 RepID=UPI000E264648|nr:S8 family serine peptidase [Sporosarcina sp. BI001-red]REB08535.1 hypothetical protein DVB69_05190 [Sporosarcina sp. BI001-red]
MKWCRLILLLLVLVIIVPNFADASEYIIQTDQIESLDDLSNLHVIEDMQHGGYFLVEYEGSLEEIKALPKILTAEDNSEILLLTTTTIEKHLGLGPDSDWGKEFLDFKSLIYGAKPVRIAIIDTGIDVNHPDLKQHIDPGISVLEEEPEVQDQHGHGTKIAGIVTGSSPESIRILPIKALNATGKGTLYSIVAGLYAAIDANVDLINISFGSKSNSKMLQDTVEAVHAEGIGMIAATGNAGQESLLYPARYSVVSAVGSINQNSQSSHFSNWGEGLDFLAPGEKVLTSKIGGGYVETSGTSLSAAYITKMAAALLSQRTIKPSEIKNELKEATNYAFEPYTLERGYGLPITKRLNYRSLLIKLINTDIVKSVMTINDSSKSWNITFSEVVENSSLTNKTIIITSNDTVVPIEITINGSQVIVKPKESYQPNELYTLHVSNPIYSANGKKLAKTVVQPFIFKPE